MTTMPPSDIVRLVIYGLVGLYISMAVARLFRGRMMTGLAALAFWILAFVALITGYSFRDDISAVADRVLATVVPGVPMESGPHQVTIVRSSDGQYVVRGQSGGTRLTFIFDTGASSVVLRAEDARKLGIDTRRLVYDAVVSTANGTAMTAATTIPDLSIGSLRETDVQVLVAKPGALQENLLGMTFLDRLASFSVARNQLVLRGE